jgi:hypothetical protein
MTRSGRTLYEKFREIQKRYYEAYEKFTRSGQNDPKAFKNFAPRDVIVQYAHLRAEKNLLFSHVFFMIFI